MKITELGIQGVKILEPQYFEDYRGYYVESYSARTLKEEFGIETIFVQDNHFLSLKKGTIRGIHFQNYPKAQSKLIRCIKGAVFCYAIDLRKGSPTYLKYEKVLLNEHNRKQLFIPKGFGHLCISIEDMTEVQYKVDEFWEPKYERAVIYNDKKINLDLPEIEYVTSEKDSKAPNIDDCDINFVYGENC